MFLTKIYRIKAELRVLAFASAPYLKNRIAQIGIVRQQPTIAPGHSVFIELGKTFRIIFNLFFSN